MRGRVHYRQDDRRNYKSTVIVNLLYQPVYRIYGLKAFQASFRAPKTPLAIILCSSVVFLTLSYTTSETLAHIRHTEGNAHLVRV